MADKFSIGQTSGICGISIQTLRYYASIGLVLPSYVNQENGYRYYTSNEIIRIKVIQNLREMNFSLKIIAELLENDSLKSYEAILNKKRSELEAERNSIDKLIEKLDAKLQCINIYEGITENASNYFEVRSIGERRIIYDRRFSACNFSSMAERFTELHKRMKDEKLTITGTLLSIYYEDIITFDRDWSDIETCIECSDDKAMTSLPSRTIPEGLYLVGCYKGEGSKKSCIELYLRMQEWLRKHDYEIVGPTMEEYIVNPLDILKKDLFITELQLPIKKIINDL